MFQRFDGPKMSGVVVAFGLFSRVSCPCQRAAGWVRIVGLPGVIRGPHHRSTRTANPRFSTGRDYVPSSIRVGCRRFSWVVEDTGLAGSPRHPRRPAASHRVELEQYLAHYRDHRNISRLPRWRSSCKRSTLFSAIVVPFHRVDFCSDQDDAVAFSMPPSSRYTTSRDPTWLQRDHLSQWIVQASRP